MQEMKGSQETKDFPVLDSRTSVLHVCNHYVPQFLLCNPYVSRARGNYYSEKIRDLICLYM